METTPDFATFVRRTRDTQCYDILFAAPHLYYLAHRERGYRAVARVDRPAMPAVIVAPRRLATTDPLALATVLVRARLEEAAVDPGSNLGVIRQAHGDRLPDSASSVLKQVTTTGGYLVEVGYASLDEYLRNIVNHDELAYLVVLDSDRKPVIALGELPAQRWPEPESDPLTVEDCTLDMAGDIRIGGIGGDND